MSVKIPVPAVPQLAVAVAAASKWRLVRTDDDRVCVVNGSGQLVGDASAVVAANPGVFVEETSHGYTFLGLADRGEAGLWRVA